VRSAWSIGLLLAMLGRAEVASAQETPRPGGILKAAMIGEPPTLDTHTTTATISYQIAWHVFETLYTYDRQYQPIPLLAESHTVTDGARRYTITLRKGVKFHNGKDLTAADAAASIARWGPVARDRQDAVQEPSRPWSRGTRPRWLSI
jgi:peptide/nickel transport system substrate-binding protein